LQKGWAKLPTEVRLMIWGLCFSYAIEFPQRWRGARYHPAMAVSQVCREARLASPSAQTIVPKNRARFRFDCSHDTLVFSSTAELVSARLPSTTWQPLSFPAASFHSMATLSLLEQRTKRLVVAVHRPRLFYTLTEMHLGGLRPIVLGSLFNVLFAFQGLEELVLPTALARATTFRRLGEVSEERYFEQFERRYRSCWENIRGRTSELPVFTWLDEAEMEAKYGKRW